MISRRKCTAKNCKKKNLGQALIDLSKAFLSTLGEKSGSVTKGAYMGCSRSRRALCGY